MLLIQWLLVFTLVVLVSSAPSSSEADVAWQHFKLAYDRQYRNLREEALRKEIFVTNFDKITSHNKLYEDGLVRYSLKINQYSDMIHEEMKKTLNGYRKSKVTVSDIEVIQFVPDEDADVSDEFDWREKGAVTPVKDQGFCGSCWAFSSTGALEGQYFLKTGDLVSISEQNLVDCSSEHNNIGCAGGDMNPAFTYVHNQDGIDSETSYPYEAVDGKCRYTVSGNVTSTRGYATIENGNEDYLKAAVATIGPIAVAIDASQLEFDFYSEGIYYNPYCNNGASDPETELDHAVLVVGYGTEDGQDYWLIKNSWGTDWGEEGYIRMARNRDNNCGVAAEASFPLNY
ncbi:cathepsin L1-like [Anoplophora glabripennis]|uniref:cathepsin L1-like n=1 Tax=Anoplophora glabripennis TaxID=217634 RepID=UPI000C76C11F|nr:cathepsin L1-like [Anoplophora glabripennis]